MSSPVPPEVPPELLRLIAQRVSVALCVHGDLGIGKSHAVKAWLAGLSCRHATVLASSSVAQIVRALPASETNAHVAARLKKLEGLGGSLGEGRQVFAPAFLAETLVQHLEPLAPFVLCLESAEDASAVQLEVLVLLARLLLKKRGLGLVVVGRRALPPPFENRALRGMGNASVTALVEAEAQAVLPQTALDEVLLFAQGNALFALEYFRFLVRCGALWNDGERWRWRKPERLRVPTVLEGVVGKLLYQITNPKTQQVLDACAIFESEANPDVWMQLAGCNASEFGAAKLELEALGLLRDNGFAYGLYRELVLQNLAWGVQQSLMQQALDWLQRLPTPSLQDHVLMAQFAVRLQLPAAEAFKVFSQTADAALQNGDAVLAAQHWGRASAVALQPEGLGLALKAADVLKTTDVTEALRLARYAHASDPQHQEAALLCADLLVQSGDARAADAVVAGMAGLEARWWPRLLALKTQAADFAGALALWQAHPERQGDAPILTLRDVAWSLVQLGDLTQAKTLLDRALQREPPAHEKAMLLNTYSQHCLVLGDPHAAEMNASKSLQLHTQHMPLRDKARALELRAEAREHQGLFVAAQHDAEEALTLRLKLGDGWGAARTRLRLAAILTELMQHERAEEMLLEDRVFVERNDARLALVLWDCQLMYLYLAWGLLRDAAHVGVLAVKHGQLALRLARVLNNPVGLNSALAHVAWVEARYGSPALALQLAEEAILKAEEVGQGESIAIELLASGLAKERLGRPGDALQDFVAAEGVLHNAQLTNSAHVFGLEVDRLRGDLATAQQRFERFVRCGHHHGVALAKKYFPALENLGQSNAARSGLWVGVLGPVVVLREGKVLRLFSKTGQVLVVMLLEAQLLGKQELSDAAIVQSLWPDDPETGTQNTLKQLVYRLRRVLGANSILRTSNGYALAQVESDLADFLKTSNLGLWRAAYLDGLEYSESEWRNTLYARLHDVARSVFLDDPRAALQGARVLLQANDLDKDALLLVCAALQRLGQRRDLQKVYQLAKARFLEVGEDLPEHWKDFVAQASF